MSIPVNIKGPPPMADSDSQMSKVKEVMAKFDDWWKDVPNGETINPPHRKHHSCGWFGGLSCAINSVAEA